MSEEQPRKYYRSKFTKRSSTPSGPEMAVLDEIDRYIAKVGRKPPEIPLYRKDAELFDSICEKIKEGMLPGRIDPVNKTYRGVPIRCQS